MTSYLTAYTDNVAPSYSRTFTDSNTGAALNLTNATISLYRQHAKTGDITAMTGAWTVQSPGSAGIAHYQWTVSDLATPGTYSLFVRVQISGETGIRELTPDVLIVLPSAEYLLALIGGIVGTDINIAGLGTGGSTTVTTNIPADVIDRVGRLLGHVIVDTLPSIAGTVSVSNFPATQAANLTQINGSALSNTNPEPVQFVSQSGYVALTSPPAQTNAGSDTTLTFGSQVNTILIQNNSTSTINFAFDTAASAGSLALAAGQIFIYSKKVTTVHLYTANAANVNGTSSGNIVVLGEL